MNVFRALVRVLLGPPARREPLARRPPPEPRDSPPQLDAFEAAPGSGVTQRGCAAHRPTWAESRADGFDGVRRRPLDLSGGVKVPLLAPEPTARAAVEPSNGFFASLDDLPVALDPLDAALIGAALQLERAPASPDDLPAAHDPPDAAPSGAALRLERVPASPDDLPVAHDPPDAVLSGAALRLERAPASPDDLPVAHDPPDAVLSGAALQLERAPASPDDLPAAHDPPDAAPSGAALRLERAPASPDDLPVALDPPNAALQFEAALASPEAQPVLIAAESIIASTVVLAPAAEQPRAAAPASSAGVAPLQPEVGAEACAVPPEVAAQPQPAKAEVPSDDLHGAVALSPEGIAVRPAPVPPQAPPGIAAPPAAQAGLAAHPQQSLAASGPHEVAQSPDVTLEAALVAPESPGQALPASATPAPPADVPAVGGAQPPVTELGSRNR